MGRPSIDPELMIRMLVVGYVFATRSERLICREVQVNRAYRWFCKLGIEDAIPGHSAVSRARNERFRKGSPTNSGECYLPACRLGILSSAWKGRRVRNSQPHHPA